MINKVVGIAIDEYAEESLNKLVNCKTDIHEIVNILKNDYEFDDITIYEEPHTTTRKAILKSLQEIFTNALKTDSIIVLFAGHGEFSKITNTAYWQPYDADSTDFSSWVDVDEIKKLIKASPARHIAIISDSCFSGALINDNLRGIDNFNRAKSRLALTSGNLEKVSDGAKGGLSPFAQVVKDVLSTNEHEIMPFNLFAGEVIKRFGEHHNQSPQFGNLSTCGHEGGSFIFTKRKAKGEVQNIKIEIKSKIKNLFIPFSQEDEDTIMELEKIYPLKNEFVKNQQYETAADLRDQELKIINTSLNRVPKYIASIIEKVEISEEQKKATAKLDKKYEEFKKEEFKRLNLKEKGIVDVEPVEDIESIVSIKIFENYWSLRINPIENLLKGEEDKLFESLEKGIIDLADHYVKLIGVSQNQFLIDKLNDLIVILQELYSTQLKLLYAKSELSRDNMIVIRQMELNTWNWIKKTNVAEANK
jgi:hypothetical protein